MSNPSTMSTLRKVKEEPPVPVYFHVYNRGVDGQPIFKTKENYNYLLTKVRQFALKNDVSILAYCLMPTHYHLLAQSQERRQISKFIQSTFNTYSQAFNKQENRSGTLFESRAKFKQITTDEYVVELSRYIHLNPIEAGLVERPEDWEFSNYKSCISQDPHISADQNFLLGFFKSPLEYKDFMETSLAKGSFSA